MSDIVVLCPTRERPEIAAQMMTSFRETAVRFSTEMILVVDSDDPRLDDYLSLPPRFMGESSVGPLRPPDPPRIMVIDDGGSLTAATNSAARRIWDDDVIIGHVGDDHRFRTVGWDARVAEALVEPGFAWGDDGFWHERLPTAVFISSIIPRTLGWYALPVSRHYGIDDAWEDLARNLRRKHYLPDVSIFQPGPGETAAAGDDVYWRAQVTREADAAAYYRWRDGGGMAADLRRLREVLR